MAHTIRAKQELLARVRRMKGQMEGIKPTLDAEIGCEQVMQFIAGVWGALAGLMAEVVKDHVRTHLVNPDKHPPTLQASSYTDAEAVEQLLDVVCTYLK